MSQVITATVENGVLKPDKPLTWPAGTRVTVSIEPLIPAGMSEDDAWEELERLMDEMSIRDIGPRMTRDQLHERR